MSIVSHVLRFCAETVASAFDVFILRPLQGLKEILAGVAQAGPELVQAAVAATIQAVEQHLTPDGQARVAQGGAMILAGAKRLVAPAVVALGFWMCWNPGILYLATAAWVFVLASCLVPVDHLAC